MTDLPTHVDIHEEGPREGFQIEPGPISTADKIKLIEALAETGLHHIQAASFVSPKIVPGSTVRSTLCSAFTLRLDHHRRKVFLRERTSKAGDIRRLYPLIVS